MVSTLSRWTIYCILLLFSLSIVLPFLYLFAVSLTNETIIARMTPDKLSWDTYGAIFSNHRFFQAFLISVSRTVVGVILNMVFSVLLAYSLSKPAMPGRSAIMIYIIITMVFTGGLIPNYIVINSIGLGNSFLVMIAPTLINAFNLILLRNFFMDIPVSLEESAKIDGASDYKILYAIILPVSKPVLATISLFYAVYHWNEWFTVLVYIRDSSLWPMQVLLRNLVMEQSAMDQLMGLSTETLVTISPEALKMASIIVATLPIAMVYPFVQKYFIRGIMLGSVKG